MRGFLQGIAAFVLGLRDLLMRAELRRVLWRMLGVLFAVMLLVSVGAFWLADALMAQFVPSGDAWYVPVLEWLVWLFSLLASIVAGVVSYMTLASVIAASWLDALCARIDRDTEAQTPWWRQTMNSMASIAMPLLHFLPFAAVSAVALLIPLAGSVIASVLWGYAGVRLLAFEVMDVPASRRGLRWRERRREWRAHRAFYLGLCGTASLALLLPVVNLLVLPACVVGLARHWSLMGELAPSRPPAPDRITP